MSINREQINAVASNFGQLPEQAQKQTRRSGKKRATDTTANGKRLTTIYLDEQNYRVLQDYAGFLANLGEKNELGQRLGASTLINQAIEDFITRHAKDIKAWREYVANAPKPQSRKTTKK